MSAAASLARIRRIAAVPLQRRLAQGNAGSLRFTVGFALFIPVLMLVGSAWMPAMFVVALGAWLVMGGMLALGWWAVFVASVFEQSGLPSSGLVPGHARHLRLALWAVAAAITLVFGLGWGALTHAWCTSLVATVAVLAAVAGMMRTRLGFVLAVLLVMGGGRILDRLPLATLVAGATPSARLAGIVTLAGVLVVALAILAAIAPRGRRGPARAPGGTSGLAVDVQRGAMPPAAAAPDARWLRLDAFTRAVSVLPVGIARRWPGVASIAGWGLLAAVAALVPRAVAVDRAAWVFGIVAVFATLRFVDLAHAAGRGLAASVRAQQLVALLPGVPRGPACARTLARRLTARLLSGLAVATAGLSVVALVLEWRGVALPWFESPDAIGAWLAACLPLVALVWRDWSRAHPPGATLLVASMAAPAALWALAMALHARHGVGLPAIEAACVAATVAWCAWRWRRMAGEPFPLPFGRFA